MHTHTMLAFVHIEKNAGTTLIHLLRLNYFLRHCDVMPLSRDSNRVFRSSDMRKVLMINPFTRSIAGHAIHPWADLSTLVPHIRYITLLRDPVKRYLSQYQYWIERLGHSLSFREFMDLEKNTNRQTQKIAGTMDVEKAKKILSTQFFLTGIVEEFDSFLLLLKKKLEPGVFQPYYKPQNIGNKASPLSEEIPRLLEKYRGEILDKNAGDIELYRYVKNELLPLEKKAFGPSFEHDLQAFTSRNNTFSKNSLRYIDYLYRKLYLTPLLGGIRMLNGLPPRGSY